MLMHDFFCEDPAQMHYEVLARRADFFKHEQKGVNAVCEIMQQLIEEGRDAAMLEGLKKGRDEERTSTAMEMLRDKKPMEEIIKYSRLSKKRIEALASQLN